MVYLDLVSEAAHQLEGLRAGVAHDVFVPAGDAVLYCTALY